MNKICILGSMNMDMVLRVKDQPKEGETILSKSFKKALQQVTLPQIPSAPICFVSSRFPI